MYADNSILYLDKRLTQITFAAYLYLENVAGALQRNS